MDKNIEAIIQRWKLVWEVDRDNPKLSFHDLDRFSAFAHWLNDNGLLNSTSTIPLQSCSNYTCSLKNVKVPVNLLRPPLIHVFQESIRKGQTPIVEFNRKQILQKPEKCIHNLLSKVFKPKEKEKPMAHPSFIIKPAKNDQYFAVLTAKNGEIILRTDFMNNKHSLGNIINSIKVNAPDAEIDDQSSVPHE